MVVFLLIEIMSAVHMMKIVRDMKGAPVVRIWMFADQTILPVVSPHILINHLLVDLLVELEVAEGLKLPQDVLIEMSQTIVIEMAQTTMPTAHLHMFTETGWAHVTLDEELPHLLGSEEVGILLEEMKGL